MSATRKKSASQWALEKWVWPNVTKDKWGPPGWNWLHELAIEYPAEPTPEDAQTAYRRIWNFAIHLPCGECQMHATTYIKTNPPNLTSTEALQAWVWRFHNSVNRRLGKREVAYEEYQAIYADEICRALWSVGCSVRRSGQGSAGAGAGMDWPARRNNPFRS